MRERGLPELLCFWAIGALAHQDAQRYDLGGVVVPCAVKDHAPKVPGDMRAVLTDLEDGANERCEERGEVVDALAQLIIWRIEVERRDALCAFEVEAFEVEVVFGGGEDAVLKAPSGVFIEGHQDIEQRTFPGCADGLNDEFLCVIHLHHEPGEGGLQLELSEDGDTGLRGFNSIDRQLNAMVVDEDING